MKKSKGKSVLIVVIVVILGLILVSRCGKSADGEVKPSPSSTAAPAAKPASPTPEATRNAEPSPTPKAAEYEITDTRFSYYVNSIGNTEFYAIIEITNTGSSNLYLADCAFDLEDDGGHLLQTESWISSCPDIIAPGEKGYFYNGFGGTSIDDDISLDNGVNLNPNITVKKARGEPVDYEVSDVSLREDTFGPTITGRVKNTTDEDDSLLYIEVIYYDADGRALAITGTNITELSAGSQKSFEISGIGLPNYATFDAISDYTIVARASYYQYG